MSVAARAAILAGIFQQADVAFAFRIAVPAIHMRLAFFVPHTRVWCT